MKKVSLATPYRWGAMSSLGDASGMLITQHNFPHHYRNDEETWSVDHDRLQQWDYDH